jgi:hypothetical protein
MRPALINSRTFFNAAERGTPRYAARQVTQTTLFGSARKSDTALVDDPDSTGARYFGGSSSGESSQEGTRL